METVKEKQVKTDNELIAEFMGFIDGGNYWAAVPPYLDLKDGHRFYPSELCFNVSWDWLMPVVEKINNKSIAVEISFSLGVVCKICFVKPDGKGFEWKSFEHTSSITATYTAVVEFIKWYNTQTTPIKQ